MQNAKWNSIDEYDDISTKDQYKAALAAGLSKEQALAACGRMSRDNARTPMQWSDGLRSMKTIRLSMLQRRKRILHLF